ncbi:hypothetical protein ACFVFS_17295 [Kitasatospora sp. NPDC057692]|uniref:hypothetical protein n=1 Tax=Kitasatospora sp. NPDC057692 TaxID=3346215 RepID=UPI0036BF2F1B
MIWDQSVVRVRAGPPPDRAGNTIKDWTTATRTTITRLSVQPVLQTERQETDRTSVVTGWRVLSEPGTAPDVRADDRIEYDGLLCEVQGEVGRWPHPVLGGTHHVEWQMRRSTG